MNIVFSSRWYPVCLARYILPALLRTGYNIFTVGPFTWKKIPWYGGMELSLEGDYVAPPGLILRDEGYFAPIQSVETRLPWAPDLWLNINSTFSLAGRPKNGIVASWYIDSPTQNYDLERTWADFNFNAQLSYCGKTDVWLPLAYSKDFHYPLKSIVPFEFDVSHVGVLGKARIVFGEMARQKGLKIHFETGPAYDQVREIYSKSRICFNWSTRGELVARVFEALSMGIPLLTDRISPENGLWELGLHENTHFKAFDDLSEGLSMAKYMLSHYDECVEMAERGQRDISGNSYDDRVKTILETVGFSGTV